MNQLKWKCWYRIVHMQKPLNTEYCLSLSQWGKKKKKKTKFFLFLMLLDELIIASHRD